MFIISCLFQGQLQFFVRSSVGDIEEYFELDFQLEVGNSLEETITGSVYGPDMTFTVMISVMCQNNFYGPSCSVYCPVMRVTTHVWRRAAGNVSQATRTQTPTVSLLAVVSQP